MEGSSTHLRCSVRIDLCALERNLGKLRAFAPETRRYIALVSADAFGYGVSASVVRLMLSGADAFAVTNAREGAQVREVGSGWRVIVMSSSLEGEEETYFANSLTPVVASLEELLRFEKKAEELNQNLDIHLRVPTEDFTLPSPKEAEEMLEAALKSKRLNLEAFCLLGTGSGAPNEGATPNVEFLNKAKDKLEKLGKKIYLHHSDICDISKIPFERALRAGLVLFGMKPNDNSILKGFTPENVLTFRTSVSQIKNLPKGATVGYGRTFELAKASKVALLSVGYGDGVPRESSQKMSVIIRGKKAEVIGRVSMDQAAIDVSDFDKIEVGDEVIIVGETNGLSIGIEEYCQRLSITPAQALTSITKRVARFYKTLY